MSAPEVTTAPPATSPAATAACWPGQPPAPVAAPWSSEPKHRPLVLQRMPVPTGMRIVFERPGAQVRPPEFCPGHLGVMAMRAMADQVLAGHGAPGRYFFRGKWRPTRPAAMDAFGGGDDDDDADEIAALLRLAQRTRAA